MNDDERLELWRPLQENVGRLIVVSLIDDSRGLRIILKSESDADARCFEISFDPYIAYRNMDESYRFKTVSNHNWERNVSLYRVNNSSWVEWLHEESAGLYRENVITHYMIVTNADVIDVLTEFQPDFKRISNPQNKYGSIVTLTK